MGGGGGGQKYDILYAQSVSRFRRTDFQIQKKKTKKKTNKKTKKQTKKKKQKKNAFNLVKHLQKLESLIQCISAGRRLNNFVM